MTKQIDELMALALELRSVSNEQALTKALALKATLAAALTNNRIYELGKQQGREEAMADLRELIGVPKEIAE